MTEKETAAAPGATPAGGQSDLGDRDTGNSVSALDVDVTSAHERPRAAALALIRNGYSPVPTVKKRCFLTAWPRMCVSRATEADVDVWPDHLFDGVGLACGKFVAVVDVDTLDPAESDRLEALAFQHFGHTPLRRVGLAPKVALVYRADGLIEPRNRAGLQILGLGQQMAAFSVHPDTKKPYEWTDRSPLEVPLADLPAVTQEQVDAFVEATELPEIEGEGGGALQSITRDTATGLVTDGREAWQVLCVLQAAREEPGADPKAWATVAREDFTRTTDLSRSTTHDFSQGGFVRKATALAKRVRSGRVDLKRERAKFKTSKGAIAAGDVGNMTLAIEMLGTRLRHDLFANRGLIRRGDGPEEVLQDELLRKLRLDVAREHFKPPKDDFYDVVLDLAWSNQFHPVRDYLGAHEWDGKPRVDRWLIEYAGAEDTPYVRAVSGITLIAAARRVRRPGVKFDEMLILETPRQGTEKSSALEALCPDKTWFTDDLPLNVDSQKAIEQTAGKWIVEAGELAGMREAEAEKIKAFLSRQVDVARMSYGRLPKERPRQFVVIGTTNAESYLKDPTGGRRFWPVRVKRFDLKALRRDRDQLWAEAAAREAAGEAIRLPQHLWAAAGIEQEERRDANPWEDALAAHLGNEGETSSLDGKLLVEDAWHLVGMHDVARRTQRDNDRLGKAVRKLGFKKRESRLEGRKRQWYVRPVDTDPQKVERIMVDLQRDKNDRVVRVRPRFEDQPQTPWDDVPF